MANIDCYQSDDYIGLDTPDVSFYYGYEETDEQGNWCFTAKGAGFDDVKIPFPDLGLNDHFEVTQCLLVGIGLFIHANEISKKTKN